MMCIMKTYENVEEVLKDVLEKYGFPEANVEEQKTPEGEFPGKMFVLRVSEEESGFLIGQYGNNLQALQHLARMIVSKKFPELAQSVFCLDVNDYRKKRDQNVVEMARSAAREADREKKSVTLRPMSSYERRLVHMELSKEKNVITRSIGEKEDRRIVVEPITEKKSV